MTEPDSHPGGAPAVRPSRLPRPRLVLRVGITGHRPNKLPGDVPDRVRRTLARSLLAIEASLLRLQSSPAGRAFGPQRPECRLVTALAEGADSLAVEAAPAHWPLDVVLPMPRDVYAADFLRGNEEASPALDAFRRHLGRAASVTELPLLGRGDAPAGALRDRHYEALGHVLVRQVDCLIAVWDGAAAVGIGGTAAVLAEALDRGIGVIWIHPGDPDRARLVERFSHGDVSRPVALPADDGALDGLIQVLLGLDPALPLPAYTSEAWPERASWAIAYPLLRALSGAGTWPRRGRPSPRWPRAPRDPLLTRLGAPEAAGAGGETRQDLSAVVLPRSIWADTLAWSHAELYRSAYMSAFILAGFAVPIGLCALFWQGSPAALGVKAGFVAVELLVILLVVAIVQAGRRRHWHAAWIETREMSELLRAVRPLLLVGRGADLFSPRPARAAVSDSFPVWYAKATGREVRPVAGRIDAGYLARVLAAMRDADLAEQLDYHRANAAGLRRLDRFLHRWGDRCFAATIGVLALYLVLWLADVALSGPGSRGEDLPIHGLLHGVFKPLVTVAAASLPAFGAALAGIRAQGEFLSRVDQSERSCRELDTIRAEINSLLVAPPEALTLERAGDLLVTAVQVMMDDVRHWRHTYTGKTLALPA